jgi:hypothetical protein
VSNLETRSAELTARAVAAAPRPGVEVIEPREVPLGGPRAMTVRRTLPQKARSLIGAWCFVDHYGPDEVALTGGMRVPPHPHTGLQTVSWLFTGELEHRDSAGHHAFVRPGELNLMTAGRGISHSEVSTAETTVLHGVQLWLALPEAARFVEPGFEHYSPSAVRGDGFEAHVFLGTAFGERSPVSTYSALLGVEVVLAAGSRLAVDLQEGFEHGVLVDQGAVRVDGVAIGPSGLGYLAPGRDVVRLTTDGERARLLLLGGEPLREPIVMWWNFVGRSHDEIARFRSDWQARIGAEPSAVGDDDDPGRFELPDGDPLPPLPAPALPTVPLRPRG